MRKKRDPRIDPKPGDEIFRTNGRALGGGVFRKVLQSHGRFIRFGQDNGNAWTYRWATFPEWRKWARKSEVTAIRGVQQ